MAISNFLQSSQVGNILSAIAPMLLGLLGQGQKKSNTGAGGLGGLLGGLLVQFGQLSNLVRQFGLVHLGILPSYF